MAEHKIERPRGTWFIWLWMAGCLTILATVAHTQAPLMTLDCPYDEGDAKRQTAQENCSSPGVLLFRSGSDLRIGAGEFIHDNRDEMTAVSTVVVAIFTGTLWWVTWGMVRLAKEQRIDTLRAVVASEAAAEAAKSTVEAMRDSESRQATDFKSSIAATQIAANAAAKSADISEKALIDLERPYLYAEVSHINFKFGPDGTIIITDASLKYKLTNYGRTPAQIIEVNATMRNKDPGPNVGIPRPPHSRMGDVIPVNDSREFILNIVLSMVNAGDMVMPEDLKKTSTIIIMGYVRFFGMFDTQYITRFCGKYDAGSGRFSTYGDSRYNYTKKDDVDLERLRHS